MERYSKTVPPFALALGCSLAVSTFFSEPEAKVYARLIVVDVLSGGAIMGFGICLGLATFLVFSSM